MQTPPVEHIVHPRPGFWDGPLGYAQSTVVVVAAFLMGCAWHVQQRAIPAVPLPVAGIASLAFVLLIALAQWRWRATRIMEWLTGIPFAVTSVSAVMLVSGIGAVVPQSLLQTRLATPSLYSSWPFAMVLLVMLGSLVGVCARRLWPFDRRNIRFLLNHGGLAVALFGAVISAAGLQRSRMVLQEGRAVSTAEDARGQVVALPFTITLRKFHLESFPPTFALAMADEKAPDGARVTPGAQFAKSGMVERIGKYTVRVAEYMPRAARVGAVWRAVAFPTAAPAARITVRDAKGVEVASGWVSSGSLDAESEMLPLADDKVIFMPAPRPREFRSTVSIKEAGATRMAEVAVNRPITVAGRRLYQISYDERMGAASTISVLEVVRDTGLPIVYAGLFMMLAGAAMLLWEGAREGGSE